MIPLVRLRCSALLFLAAVVLVVSGCGGGKGSKVKGKLILPADVKVGSDDAVQINLISKEGNYGLAAKSDGGAWTFESTGKEGVPPGDYKVAVLVQAYPGKANPNAMAYNKLNNAFSEAATPLTVKIEKGDQSFTVDLAAKTVKKE